MGVTFIDREQVVVSLSLHSTKLSGAKAKTVAALLREQRLSQQIADAFNWIILR